MGVLEFCRLAAKVAGWVVVFLALLCAAGVLLKWLLWLVRWLMGKDELF